MITVLSRLRQRPFDIRQALHGQVLTVSINLTDSPWTAYSIVFSPDGHMSVFTPEQQDFPHDFTPHVRLRGTADQVLRVVLGETNTFDAVFSDVLELNMKPSELTPHYPLLMRVVREEAWALLEADRARE